MGRRASFRTHRNEANDQQLKLDEVLVPECYAARHLVRRLHPLRLAFNLTSNYKFITLDTTRPCAWVDKGGKAGVTLGYAFCVLGQTISSLSFLFPSHKLENVSVHFKNYTLPFIMPHLMPVESPCVSSRGKVELLFSFESSTARRYAGPEAKHGRQEEEINSISLESNKLANLLMFKYDLG
jgi:hypothetical protein